MSNDNLDIKTLEIEQDIETIRQEVENNPNLLWNDILKARKEIKDALQNNALNSETKLDYIIKLIEYIEPRLDIIMGLMKYDCNA